MCYSALVKNDLKYLSERYGAVLVREQIDDYLNRSEVDSKTFPPIRARIFPGYYAPIIFVRNGQRVIELMRYGAYPPAHIQDPKRYTTYNARRDNLTSRFWSDAFQLHHGFIVLTGFFEWVLVEELLKAGAVHLQDVVSEFDRLSHGRRDQLQNQGKKWRPTPSELMEPAKRRIVIQFHPEDQEDLVVPVIFSKSKLSDGQVVAGFAIVTDTPPPEVLQAGHDRCPVVLRPGIESAWINVDYKAVKEFDALLTERRPLKFQHRLARAVEVS